MALFQDAAGKIPVTLDGQPVGLITDKSRGLNLGPELVTNGDFSNGLVDWSGTSTAWSVVNGKLVSVVDNSYLYQIFTEGVFVELTLTAYLGTVGYLSISMTTGSTTYKIQHTDSGKLTFRGVITGNSYIYFKANSGWDGAIDNISVKRVLGNHAIQPVAAARPTYNDTPDRLTLDKVDDSIVVNVPVGGWIGSMVIGTNEGTASYGVNIPAGDYALGGRYFPGNTINNLLLRDGAVSASDLAKVEADFVKDGATASYGDVTNFTNYWRDMGEITSFPLIDTSSGTSFITAWANNNLTSFPLIDTSSGTNFSQAWDGNPALSTFPANMFDNCPAINFTQAFANTGLSQSSIDGILVSINSNGTSNGTFDQSGGSAPSAAGEAEITAMRSRGWTITVTGGF